MVFIRLRNTETQTANSETRKTMIHLSFRQAGRAGLFKALTPYHGAGGINRCIATHASTPDIKELSKMAQIAVSAEEVRPLGAGRRKGHLKGRHAGRRVAAEDQQRHRLVGLPVHPQIACMHATHRGLLAGSVSCSRWMSLG